MILALLLLPDVSDLLLRYQLIIQHWFGRISWRINAKKIAGTRIEIRKFITSREREDVENVFPISMCHKFIPRSHTDRRNDHGKVRYCGTRMVVIQPTKRSVLLQIRKKISKRIDE